VSSDERSIVPAADMDSLFAGKLAYFFAIAVADAALLSWAALRWFRRTVRTLMSQRSAGAVPSVPAPRATAPLAAGREPAEPAFAVFEIGGAAGRQVQTRREQPFRRRLILVYGLAAAAHSLVMTGLEIGADPPGISPVGAFARWWANAWPLVPALIALLVLGRGRSVRLAVTYLGAGAAAVAVLTALDQIRRGVVTIDPLSNAFWFLASLMATAAIPALLLLITGWRRIRAVTPLALAATLVFGLGSALAGEAMLRAFDRAALREGLFRLAALTSTEAAYYGAFMVMSLPIGAIAWWLLRRAAGAFRRKRFSDVQLVVDCWWLIVSAAGAIVLAARMGPRGVAGAAAAFAVYRALVAIGLWGWRIDRVRPRRLLLLRVFGYRARTEALFDRVAQRWRFRGPVQLVAGVDLATRTPDPGDILNLLAGRTAEQYVTDPEALARRLDALDVEPDPDGRFRVNEVYCHDHTWRPALGALLDRSDRVLIDVRSFSARNHGGVFELEQLVWRLPSEAIVLVVDRSTDLPRLAEILDASWRAARAAGRARGDGRLALVRVERAAPPEIRLVTSCLLGTATPRRVLGIEAFRPAASA
jgi:hypothetical protein